MKGLILIAMLSLLLTAKTVTVYDSNDGYKYYDIQSTGTTTTIYDYDDASYKTVYH
jgi:hypothetical protein